jgi:hypothetical protein
MARPHDIHGGGRRSRSEPPKDEPQDDEQRAHDALTQWGVWLTERPRPGRATSLEGRYNARADEGRGAEFRLRLRPLVRLPRPISDPLCTRVNAAMMRLPPDYAQALEMRYHRRVHDAALCRMAGVRPEQYPQMMRSARLALDAIVFVGQEQKKTSDATLA